MTLQGRVTTNSFRNWFSFSITTTVEFSNQVNYVFKKNIAALKNDEEKKPRALFVRVVAADRMKQNI